MKKYFVWGLLCCLAILPAGASAKTEMTVLAAASLTDAMEEIIQAYEQENPDVDVIASYDASGKLLTQMRQGVPADLFFSAAQKQMDMAQEEGLLMEEPRVNLLENKAVLIVPAGRKTPDSFENIAEAAVIAIGDPDAVPAGSYAKEIFESIGNWDALCAQTGKLVLAGNVREVLTFVATGNADAGVVYATDAKIEPDVEVICSAPEGSCEPIIYPASVLRSAGDAAAAQDFLAYVAGETGMKAFEKYGFTACAEEAQKTE
jgi:molybdate transport system substrate-binding protein